MKSLGLAWLMLNRLQEQDAQAMRAQRMSRSSYSEDVLWRRERDGLRDSSAPTGAAGRPIEPAMHASRQTSN